MSRTARLPISADRYTPCIRRFDFRGIDLDGAALQMSIRLRPDTPGAPLADLLTVANGNQEGLRLVGVDRTGPVPVSTVMLKINESTLAALPYGGELGDVTELAYDWQVTLAYKRVILAGAFLIVAGVVGANAAPVARPASFGQRMATSGGDWSTATLTISDDATEVSLNGVDLLEPILLDARSSRDAAQTAAATAQAIGASLSGAVLITQTNADPAKIIASKPDGAMVRPFSTELVMRAPAPRGIDDGGVELQIAGFNQGDPRQVIRESGEQIEPLAWAQGQRLRLYFDGAVFRLVEPIAAPAIAGGPSEYQQIALSHARMGV